MKKARYMFLTLISFLLIVPHVFSNGDGKGRKDRDLGVNEDQIKLVGNVKVRSTLSGHITVSIDGSLSSSIQPDGTPDYTWHFVPKKDRPEQHFVSIDVEGATILFTSRRVTLMSGDSILMNLSMEKAPKGEIGNPYYNDLSRNMPGAVRIERGIALVRYPGDSEGAARVWRCGEAGGLCGARVAVNQSNSNFQALDDEVELEGGCPAGGAGSSSCSLPNCCSVSCQSGYYACCHCTNGCHCVKNGGGGLE